MKKSALWISMSVALASSSLLPTLSFAQQGSTDDEAATTLDTISIVGSRRANRSETDSVVPVDVISMRKPASQGAQFDLAQTLQFIAPSFNSTRQTGADNADLIDSAALRGLGSDQTLVLVNGKRLHSTSLVNLFGARNRGNTGTDLNTVPLLAVERVEILRDGAAAQYGSDAIAGVMNIALKKSEGCEAVFGIGQYSRGDGENYLGSGYCGFKTAGGGSIAMTAEYLDRGRSDRTEANNPRIIGDSEVQNQTFYINGEIPTQNGAVYFNGGLQHRDASSAAFARGGVGSDDIPSRNSAALYPNGFVPFIEGDIQDLSGTVGLWQEMGEWRADISTTFGRNELENRITNTLNASIANRDRLNGGRGISATEFNAGGFAFSQHTTNLDITRYFPGVMNGLNLAFGGEYRRDNYEIFAGEPGSYIDADGAGGGSAGSQGFPGFQPNDAVDSSRNSKAVYVDTEVEFTEAFTLAAAARVEDYSDFGATTDGKLAAAFKPNDRMVLRASVSTGFRAPSLQQRLFSSTFTDFISGRPVDVVLAPNGGRIANAAGIPALTEETSRGYTVGFTFRPTDATSITLDGYRIDIDDRIVLSGRFDTTDPTIGRILQQLGVGQAQFFVNAVDTKTQGVDLTVSHTNELWNGMLATYLAVNHSTTEVTRIKTPPTLRGREDVFLSDRERLFLEEGAPRAKATLGFDFTRNAWNTNLKFLYFGSQTLGTFSGPPVPNQEYGGKASADLSFSYTFNEQLKLTVGGANIFDQFPDEQDDFETDNGFRYESVQFGLNGASYFARLAVKF